MMTPEEREEIRDFVHQELATIEHEVEAIAGSFNYVCVVGGLRMFTHHPVGAVLRAIPHY